VAGAPDYAAALVQRAGIDLFIVRTGFDPKAAHSVTLAQAADTIRELGAELWLLVGAWWGEGIARSPDTLSGVGPWPPWGAAEAHEAQWPMRAPGGAADHEVVSTLRALITRYEPEGVCLTHARFRHPADIPGLFEVGTGRFLEHMQAAGLYPDALKAATRTLDARLRKLTPAALEHLAHRERLPEFLDALIGESLFSRWFRLRTRVVLGALEHFRAAAKGGGPQGMAFSTNAYAPLGAPLCGQDYAALGRTCDVVQPLLGYLRWHVLQPILAWARFLQPRVVGLKDAAAIEVAAALFGVQDLPLAPLLESSAGTDEGSAAFIESAVAHQLRAALAAAPTAAMMPVLRGHGWPRGVLTPLTEQVRAMGFAGVVYQGTEALVGPPPRAGWQ
jgi:hypothetical protein